MDDNIQNCCRICLDVESNHVPILEDSLIHLQVKSCLPITVAINDNLPKSICEPCVALLNDFYNFQLNARCSQDWLESSIQKKAKNTSEIKLIVQPLPDSEYNSDSLLEFLNNTANIEEYLNNLGKEDIPSIVNMLDKTESGDMNRVCSKIIKQPSPKKKEHMKAQTPINMDIDVLDSDLDIVKEILLKETDPKKQVKNTEKTFSCFGCKTKVDGILKLSQHLSICDKALRTCIHCNQLFDSKQKMCQHLLTHTNTQRSNSGYETKPLVLGNNMTNHIISNMGFIYSCKQCGDTFTDRLKLYKHAREHVVKTEEKICDICGHVFQGNDVLLKHRKEQHEKPEKFLYRCKVCSFTSPDRKQIYSHVARHTQVKHPNRHLCESCGQSFATQATMIRHSQQHNSERHKCHVCNKKFSDSMLKEKHLLEHVEMVMCEKCGIDINILKLDKHLCA